MKLETKMNFFRKVALFFSLLIGSFVTHAQDCTLDIGGKNTETLIRVFQMNASQIEQLETLRAELELETKTVDDEIQKLFDSHPQSTPEELTNLAAKYKVLQAKIVTASAEADKKLLRAFNQKQYDRYLDLCQEAFRRPFKVVPSALSPSETTPE